MIAERVHDLVAFVVAQQAVIDEYAGQLVADGLVQQRRNHRRIDAAREAQQDLAVPDLLTHTCDRVCDDVAGRPVTRAAADVVHEALHDRLALQRMRDLRMKLHAVEAPAAVLHGCQGRIPAAGRHLETRRQCFHAVAVAHPHLEEWRPAFGVAEPTQQAGVARLDFRVTELAVRRCFDLAAQFGRHGLHAVANAEDGHAELEDRVRDARRVVEVHRLRSARQDHAGRPERSDGVVVHVPGMNFRVDAALAHAARD